MSDASCFVSVVVPARNDADILPGFLAELSSLLGDRYAHHEIVVVDDGSSDGTAELLAPVIVRLPSCRLIRLSAPFGIEAAILAGLESAIGDYVAVLQPDTDPPALIPEMVELARAGASIVSGVRAGREDLTLPMRLLAPLFYGYVNGVLKLALPRGTTELRVLARPVVDAVIRSKDLLRFRRMYSNYAACRSAIVPYVPGSRRGRPRRRSFAEVMRRSFGIIVANSTHPLRLLAVLALAVAGICSLQAIWTLVTSWKGGAGFVAAAAQAFQPSGLFAFLLLIQSVLCTYVARMIEENGRKPHYHVAEEVASPMMVDEERQKNVVFDATGPERASP